VSTEAMDVANRRISDQLHLMGQILEILDENPFKVRAYTRAAELIERLATPVADISLEELESIEGIGTAIAQKVSTYRTRWSKVV